MQACSAFLREVGLARARVKATELVVGLRRPGAFAVGDEQRLERADGLVLLAILRKDEADGEERRRRGGGGILREFLERRDGFGQLLGLARAFQKGAERIEPRRFVFGQLIGLLVRGGREIELAERTFRAAEAEIRRRDQRPRKSGGHIGHLPIGRDGLVGLVAPA